MSTGRGHRGSHVWHTPGWARVNGSCGNSWDSSLHGHPSITNPPSTSLGIIITPTPHCHQGQSRKEGRGTRDVPVLGPHQSFPTRGGRQEGEGHSSDLPRAISFSFASSHPLLGFDPGHCQVPLCSHQLAVAVLVSWSCPYSRLSLGWDLPQTGHHLPSKPCLPWPQQPLLVGSSSSAPQASLMQLVQM